MAPSSSPSSSLGACSKMGLGPFLSPFFLQEAGMLNLASMDELPGARQPLKFYAKVMGRCTYPCAQGEGLSVHLMLRGSSPGQAQ